MNAWEYGPSWFEGVDMAERAFLMAGGLVDWDAVQGADMVGLVFDGDMIERVNGASAALDAWTRLLNAY